MEKEDGYQNRTMEQEQLGKHTASSHPSNCDGHRARENHSEANPTAAKPSWKPQHLHTFCLGLKTVLVRKDHSKSQNRGKERGGHNQAQQVPLCL